MHTAGNPVITKQEPRYDLSYLERNYYIPYKFTAKFFKSLKFYNKCIKRG